MPDLRSALSPEERKSLADLLACQAPECRPMDLAMLEGFLTAVVIGPTTVLPSLWMPWVWDHEEGRAAPIFDNLEQANRGMALLMRFMNGIALAFMDEPPSFVPAFRAVGEPAADAWCGGFQLGTQFSRDDWARLWVAKPELVAPILGPSEEGAVVERSGGADGMTTVRSALTVAHAFWKARRMSLPPGLTAESLPFGNPRAPVTRAEPKVGRNDPCPCGSGRKYKKCCGADRGPTIH